MSPAKRPEPVLDDDEDPALAFTRPRKTANKTQTPEVPNSGSRRARAGSEGQPKYRQMIRVEGRLRPDQIDELSNLRRALSRARTDNTERITDNTLLRVAVDLLLARRDVLAGNTEDELREAATTGLPD
jgi:hypothetical protein